MAAAVVLPLAGCNDINPNLGAAASFSSTISYITPASRPAGCSGFTLDVLGVGFTGSSVVNWNGTPRSTNYESSGELLATINASDVATATQTPVSIVVDTPSTTQGNNLSNFVTFTIAPAPQGTCPAPRAFLPTIIELDQADVTVGSTLQIAGTYFGGVQNASSTVAFNVAATATTPATSTLATVTSWSCTLGSSGSSQCVIAVTVPSIVPAGTQSVSATVVVTIAGLAATPLTATPLTAGANLVNVLPAATTTSSVVLSSSASANATRPFPAAPNRYLAFVSSTDPSGAVGTAGQVFLRDTCQGVHAGCTASTVPISLGFDGTDPNGASRSPSVSTNGRFVAFASDANNLVRGDANGVTDIFVRDTCIGAPAGCVPNTTRVSTGPDGIESNGASASPSISLDGRFVVFQSVATNLVSDGGGGEGRFLWDSCSGAPMGCKPSLTKLKFASPSR